MKTIKKILLCYFHPTGKISYTPLDIGYVVSQSKRRLPSFDFVIQPLIYNRSRKSFSYLIENDVERIQDAKADAIFFFLDNVLWSQFYALGRAIKIAKLVRKSDPKIFLGFQSYKIQNDEINEVLSHGIVDCVVMNNPEHSLQFLDRIMSKEKVDGTVYWSDSKKRFLIYPESSKTIEKDLGFLPSPYLEGIFDNFLARRQLEYRQKFMAFIYSARGCPFKCCYCFRGTKNEKVRFFPIERFYDEVEYLFNKFSIRRFFILDDVFLAFPSRLEKFLKEFKKRKNANPRIEGIRLNAMIRPELISDHTIPLLRKINVRWVQVGLQTINPDLQWYMNRKLSSEKLKETSKKLHINNIMLHLDIIMGLPNDTVNDFKKTLDYALELNPCSLQINQFYLNPGTHFYKKKVQYNLEATGERNDFNAPYVQKTSGEMDKIYLREAINYVKKKILKHPDIHWKFLTQHESFISKHY